MFKKAFRLLLALVLLSGLVFSTFSLVFAEGTTYQYNLYLRSSFVDIKQQFNIGLTVMTTGSDAEKTNIILEIPEGIVIPGSIVCESGNACTYTTFMPADSIASSRTSYLWGYATKKGIFVFTAHFQTGNSPETVIQKEIYLDPIGYPKIESIEPNNPIPGQKATIKGTDFLPLAYKETSDQLQVCFFIQGWDGLDCTAKILNWDATSIEITVLVSLPSGMDVNIVIIRGKYSSMATPFSVRLNYGYFLPMTFK